MATQVKFYSTAEYESTQTAGGIYFVGSATKGELYKGTQRFGGGRVTEVATTADRDALVGVVQGDIVVCEVGGAFAYDGAKWVAVGPDMANMLPSYSAGGTGKIITDIAQGTDGAITATAITFPQITSPDDGVVSLAGTSVKISGWDDLVSKDSDLESRVSSLETVVDGKTKTVTATTGNFTNLNVSGTADMTVVDLKATTLTVDDETKATFGTSTISQIADRQIDSKIAALSSACAYASDNGVYVNVVTEFAEIAGVTVSVDATTSKADLTSTNTALARAKDVYDFVMDEVADLTGAMHFEGVKESLPASTSEAEKGDIIIVGSKEYVSDGTKWIELGDETAFGNLVDYTGYKTELTTGNDNLADAINTLDAELGTITSAAMGTTATTVSGAIKEIKEQIAGLDTPDGGATDTDAGVTVTVTQADGKVTDVDVGVTLQTTIAATNTDTEIPSAKAVYTAINALESSITGGDSESDDDGVKVTVAVDEAAAPTVTVEVTGVEEMALNDKGTTTVATTKAIASYYENNMVWLKADGTAL